MEDTSIAKLVDVRPAEAIGLEQVPDLKAVSVGDHGDTRGSHQRP
jgi:hypothetical protein